MPADADCVVCLLCPRHPANFAFAFILSIFYLYQVIHLSLRMPHRAIPVVCICSAVFPRGKGVMLSPSHRQWGGAQRPTMGGDGKARN